MGRVEFRILGPLEAVDAGKALPLGSRKQRALLALLLVQNGAVVSRDRLIEELWRGEAPPMAGATLLAYISRLRKVIGPDRLRTRPPGYQLALEPDELDATRFERSLAAARSHGLRERARRLREALALWRGPVLADLAFEPFAESEIRRLEELRIVALEERIEAELELGLHTDLVAELERMVRENPLRERPRGQHMLALYRCGRQAEALESYQEFRRLLTDGLGLEPSPALKELQKAILSQDESLAAAAPTPSPAGERADVERSGLLLGRDAEIQTLWSALDQTLTGQGRLVLIGGEPGIGKSRLADELAAEARMRGVQVLVGRCWEAGGAPAFWPWVQALRVYLGERAPERWRTVLGPAATRLAQILPELRELDPEPDRSSSDPDAARFQLFEAISSFLRRASRTQPLVLVLDDLHAADAPSLLLLRFLAEEIGRARLLVIGCYRTLDPAPKDPLSTTLVALSRRPETAFIELTGLSEPDVTRFIEHATGLEPQERAVREIGRATEGNPLYLVEILRLLATEEALESMRDPGWRLEVPESVHAVIRLRLRHLSEEAKLLLTLASVLGREFGLDALEQVSGVRDDQLLAVLDEAAAERIVTDVPGAPGRLRFSHALIRETLYDELPPGRRLQLHRRVGEALESLYATNLEPHLDELAYHFFESTRPKDAARALDYAERAAERSLQLLAYEEAARHYTTALRALHVVDKPEPQVRGRLLLGLGDAQQRAGESAQAKETFLLAAEAARRDGPAERLAQAALGYGGRYVWARASSDMHLVPHLEEALSLLGAEDSALRARLLARLAGALRDDASPNRRSALSTEAVALARRVGDPAALVFALSGHLSAALAADDAERRLAVANELLEVATETRDTEGVFEAHDHRSSALMELGDIEALDRTDEQMARLAGSLRQPAQLWLLTTNRALRALLAGRFTEAEQLVYDALEMGARAQPREARFTFRLQLAALRKAQGRLAEIEPEIERSLSDYPDRAVFPCLLVDLRARLGREDRARELLAQIDIDALPTGAEWLYPMHFLCEACAALNDTDRASVLYELLVPHAQSTASLWADGNAGSVARYLGLLSTTRSRLDEAAAHYEAALAMNRRLGARPWLAHTQEDYARMLFARGDSKDAARARSLLNDALATYSELGMNPHAAVASAPSLPLGAKDVAGEDPLRSVDQSS
jgi:DNA-binding SARP family transcriptional activator